MAMGEFYIVVLIIALAPIITVATIAAIAYLVTLQMAFATLNSKYSHVWPAAVWLNLIPLFNIFWHLYLSISLARSYRCAYRGLERQNTQGSYGLEPAIALFVANLVLAGLTIWFNIAGSVPLGIVGSTSFFAAFLMSLVALAAHWAVVYGLYCELRR